MTTDAGTAPPPEPAAPEARLGFVQRVGGVLMSPDDTFRDIAARPNVLAPLVLLIAVGIVGAALLVPRMDFATMIRDQMEHSPKAAQMSPSDIDRSVRIGSSFAKIIGYSSPVLAIGIWAIIALVFWLTFRLFGSEGTYKQAFAATLYAWIPLTINSIIGMIVAMTRTSIDPESMATIVASNPGVFVDDIHAHRVLFSFLTSIDLFTIWTIVLLIIGFAHVARTSKARSAAVVLSWWAVFIFFRVGFAALGAARMKAGS